MKYLFFSEEPNGNPKIGDKDYVSPIPYNNGWIVDFKFKDICIYFGWNNFTEIDII